MKTIDNKTILLCIIALALLTTACSVEDFLNREVIADTLSPKPNLGDQVLRVVWQGEFPLIEIENAVYEGLVRLNERGHIAKGSGLAKDWEISEDGLTYTFYLREAYWSDGTKITAYDFHQTWMHMLTPGKVDSYVELFYQIENAKRYHYGELHDRERVGIQAKDEGTLVVVLEEPNSSFIYQIASPSHFLKDPRKFSGPFVIVEQDENRRILLEKNAYYWDRENVPLKGIEGVVFQEDLQEIEKFDKKEIHIASLSTVHYPAYKQDPHLKTVPTGVTWWIQFNTKNAILQNEKVRRALALSIDRKKLVENILRKGDAAAYGVVPFGIQGMEGQFFREGAGKLFDDVGDDGRIGEVAKGLLEQGLKEVRRNRSDFKSITLLVQDTPTAKNIGKAIQAMWKEYLEIEIQVEVLPIKLLLDRMDRGEYQMAYTGWAGDYNDPEAFLSPWRAESHYNDTGWKNKDFEKWLKEAAETTAIERNQRLIRAEKILIGQMPMIPIYFRNEIRLIQKEVKGFIYQSSGGYTEYKYMWIE